MSAERCPLETSTFEIDKATIAVNIYCMQSKRDTERVLLDAAAEEFAQYGLNGARMQAIVARAGINERMIYHHFGSKVGLYEAVLRDHFQPAPGLMVARKISGDPLKEFVATFGRFATGLLARPQFVALVLHEGMTGWAHVPKASLSDIPDPLRKSFEAARRAGMIRKDCRFEVLYLTALGAMVSCHFLAGRFSDLRTKKARDRLVIDVLDLVLRGAKS
jgi:AcrR family transcriptional regulator